MFAVVICPPQMKVNGFWHHEPRESGAMRMQIAPLPVNVLLMDNLYSSGESFPRPSCPSMEPGLMNTDPGIGQLCPLLGDPAALVEAPAAQAIPRRC